MNDYKQTIIELEGKQNTSTLKHISCTRIPKR